MLTFGTRTTTSLPLISVFFGIQSAKSLCSHLLRFYLREFPQMTALKKLCPFAITSPRGGCTKDGRSNIAALIAPDTLVCSSCPRSQRLSGPLGAESVTRRALTLTLLRHGLTVRTDNIYCRAESSRAQMSAGRTNSN